MLNEKLVQWLNLQVDLKTKQKESAVFKKGISVLTSLDSIHLDTDSARKIIEELELKFYEDDFVSTGATAKEVSFYWKGTRFFSLEDFREVGVENV